MGWIAGKKLDELKKCMDSLAWKKVEQCVGKIITQLNSSIILAEGYKYTSFFVIGRAIHDKVEVLGLCPIIIIENVRLLALIINDDICIHWQ